MAEANAVQEDVTDAAPLDAMTGGDQPIVTEDFTPDSEVEPAPGPEQEPSEPKEPDKSGSDEAEAPKAQEWDKQRQQNDEVRAIVKNLADTVKDIGVNQAGFAKQVREALLEQAPKVPVDTPPAELTKLDMAMKVLDEMKPEEVENEEMLAGVQNALSEIASQATRPTDTSQLDAIAKRLDDSDQRVKAAEDREKARDERDLQDAANRRVNGILDSLDQKHSPGKKTFRTPAVKAAQEEMKGLGFVDGNDPHESTFIVSLRHNYERLANEALASERQANKPAGPEEDGEPFKLDPMTGGQPTVEKAQTGSNEDVFAGMRAEGHKI